MKNTKPNFAQPVSMPCTLEQFNRDLKEGLEGLGWESREPWNSWVINDDHDDCSYIHLEPERNEYDWHNHYNGDQHKIPTYNPELFLAIAAMTKGDVPIVGEYVIDKEKPIIEQVRIVNNKKGIQSLHHGPNDPFQQIETANWARWFRRPTLTELINHFTKPKTMKREFPIEITAEQAQSIIDIAYGEWRERLGKKWGKQIVLGYGSAVPEKFYNTMRSACNDEQHALLDKIFGKDEPEQEFKVGVHVYVITGGSGALGANCKVGKIIEKPDKEPENYGGGLYGKDENVYIEIDGKVWNMCRGYELRHATPSEIAEAKAKMQEKELEQKDGEDRLDYVLRLLGILDKFKRKYFWEIKLCEDFTGELFDDNDEAHSFKGYPDLITQLKTYIKNNLK